MVFHGFSLVSIVVHGNFMVFHGFWLVLMVFHGFWLVFVVQGWFFMVPGRFSLFSIAPGWLFRVLFQNVTAGAVSWPTIQPRSAARRAAQDLVSLIFLCHYYMYPKCTKVGGHNVVVNKTVTSLCAQKQGHCDYFLLSNTW